MENFRIIMTARYLPPEYSGAAAQAFLLAHRLRERGHSIELVTQSWRGEHREYDVEGFKVTALKTNLKARHSELSLWRNLFVYLWKRRYDFDVLHAHGAYYTQAIVGPFARALGKRSLVKASLADNDLKSLTSSSVGPLHRFFLDRVDAYVAISADLEREFAAKGLKAERIHTIPNGVDMERFRPADPAEKRALAESMGIPGDRPIGLFVGVFDERKKIAWLMEEWIRTRAFGTGTRLLAVGPTSRDDYGPELKQRLEELAADHPDLLTVRDFTPEIERYYRLSSFFVFPSSNEGLPNAVLEAMACALPCVATRISGCCDLIHDGDTGVTFEVGSAEELATAVARVQGEPGLRLGAAARRFVQEGYEIDRIAARYEALYRRLTDPRGTAAKPDETESWKTQADPDPPRGPGR
jgi:glycosyltransferase involved in cell wall biosynthesis